MEEVTTLGLILGAYVGGPTALAMLVVRANWRQTLAAYGVVIACLALVASGGQTVDEQIGWMLILGLFFTLPGVPLIAVLLRVFRILA